MKCYTDTGLEAEITLVICYSWNKNYAVAYWNGAAIRFSSMISVFFFNCFGCCIFKMKILEGLKHDMNISN